MIFLFGSNRKSEKVDVEKKPFFTTSNQDVGIYDPKDDLLHREFANVIEGDALTETHYFGISLPEHRIIGMYYCWWHPNLNIVSGGIEVQQGIKNTILESELVDWHFFLHDRVLDNDIHDYSMIPGLRAKIIEPGRHFRVEYHDDSRDNHVDVEYVATMEPFMFASGRHFEQTMKTSGEVVLRGKSYDVSAYSVRDRSWGQLRPAEPLRLPPTTWMNAVFSDDFSFCCSALDPDLGGQGWPAKSAEDAFVGGFLQKDGVVRPIVSCRKEVERDGKSSVPEALHLALADSDGRTLEASARIIAGTSHQLWGNARVHPLLAEWSCGSVTGYGDVQDLQWTDYLYEAARARDSSAVPK